jgi:vacuolar-type H+-ATPase subunit I/STV1
MKNFQQNLLIVLAICLCGLCAYQWYGQTVQRSEVQKLNQIVYDKSIAIRDDTNSIATLNHQISEMDANLTELRNEAKTNTEIVSAQKIDLARLNAVNEGLSNELTQYKNAVGTLTNKLSDAYAGIEKQNTALKTLAAERDNLVQKYNDEVKDRNNIVSNYNALATRVQEIQESREKR